MVQECTGLWKGKRPQELLFRGVSEVEGAGRESDHTFDMGQGLYCGIANLTKDFQ